MTPSEHSEHTAGEQPVFGMKRAAEIAGISVSTIRRNKSRLEECGAVISPDGWKVPISALVASGLMKPTTPTSNYPESERGPQAAAQDRSETPELERQLREMHHQVEMAKERQKAAEQKARDAQVLAENLIETLRIERLMLMGPPSFSENQEAPQEDPHPPFRPGDGRKDRGSWRRWFKSKGSTN